MHATIASLSNFLSTGEFHWDWAAFETFPKCGLRMRLYCMPALDVNAKVRLKIIYLVQVLWLDLGLGLGIYLGLGSIVCAVTSSFVRMWVTRALTYDVPYFICLHFSGKAKRPPQVPWNEPITLADTNILINRNPRASEIFQKFPILIVVTDVN